MSAICVEQPVSAAVIGDVFRAVGEQHFAVEAVAIPGLAASELAQIGFGEGFLLAHGGLPFFSWLLGAAAAAPLAFAENGGVQAASGFAGTRNATRSARPFARNRVCRYGWKALAAR